LMRRLLNTREEAESVKLSKFTLLSVKKIKILVLVQKYKH
jgi:hypothetical protein